VLHAPSQASALHLQARQQATCHKAVGSTWASTAAMASSALAETPRSRRLCSERWRAASTVGRSARDSRPCAPPAAAAAAAALGAAASAAKCTPRRGVGGLPAGQVRHTGLGQRPTRANLPQLTST
jgi:hypothetical protein